MAKNIKIDENLCIGCGSCAAICDKVFEIDKQGKAKIKGQDKNCNLKEVEQTCPVQAIKYKK